MSNALTGKTVIITGASSGIGEATARLLAREGCKLTLAARSADKLEALANELQADCLVVRADMTEPADIAAMTERTQARFGRIDVMLANAGVYIPGQFADGDIDALFDDAQAQRGCRFSLRSCRHSDDESGRRRRYHRHQLHLRA